MSAMSTANPATDHCRHNVPPAMLKHGYIGVNVSAMTIMKRQSHSKSRLRLNVRIMGQKIPAKVDISTIRVAAWIVCLPANIVTRQLNVR